jgi:putative membrane protein
MDIFQQSISGFPAFITYFLISIVLLVVFLFIYIRVTPYREIQLIRDGNIAAAVSLSGAMLGFAIPLAHAIAQSVSIPDMLIWGVIALLVQILVYKVVLMVIPSLTTDIPADKAAQGVFLGALSLTTGILNAACMTY